jgi:cytochrome c2
MTAISPSRWNRLVWFAAAGVLLVLLPVLKYSEYWWQLPREQKLAVLFVAGTFGGAALLALVFEREPTWGGALRTAVRGVAVLGLSLLAIGLLGKGVPRYLLVPLFIGIAVIIPLAVSPLARSRIPAALLTIVAIGMTGYALSHVHSEKGREQAVRESYVRSAFYTVQATSREGYVPRPATRGGGLDRLGDRILLGTGDGFLYLLDIPQGHVAPKVEKLATRVPHNRDEFAAAFGGSSNAPTSSSEYSEAGPPRVQTWRFRVADVIAKAEGDRIRIFASHHWWKQDEQCFVVRVSQIDAPAAQIAAGIEQAQWRTLYESSPCIALAGPQRKRGKNPFKGEEIGGRLALLDDRTLLLTLGDQGFSGAESLQAFAQDPDAAYGKTIRIDLATGSSAQFTMGHRNPQGLYVAKQGEIWETEHGAQGGDEVNLLEESTNYGWPTVTYGTDYGSSIWPVSRTQGRHDDFRQPRYSWLPSVGISQIIRIERDSLFPIWKGNLLVGSLSTRSLYRLVTDEGRIVLSEPIALGKRVRDILELDDGRILIWTDDAALVTLEPAKGDDGETLFATQCSGCHAIVDGMSHRLGPDLRGVVGRRIASARGYEEYSAALRAQRGEWTQERLDEFLHDPQAMAPGNSMGFAGVQDAKHRAALIEYLSQRSRK